MAQPRTLRVRVPPSVHQIQMGSERVLMVDGSNIVTLDPANYPYDLAIVQAAGGVPIAPAVLTNSADAVNGQGMLTVRALGL